ncbi:hypothetical protein EV667_2546 [Ancylobacter aquaticus]|uniref:Uncharacterized protein n=1 Tax=Ancylobacter aquaticus TaxID=100 RepID=A0A4R1I3G5_ANCAQ|nr:hypothetical protein EV667_2546 [Ancylobacter aquaticus]
MSNATRHEKLGTAAPGRPRPGDPGEGHGRSSGGVGLSWHGAHRALLRLQPCGMGTMPQGCASSLAALPRNEGAACHDRRSRDRSAGGPSARSHGGTPGWKSSRTPVENACNGRAGAAILAPFARAASARSSPRGPRASLPSAFEVVAE